jgi:excisionase family DNA binding protein
MTKQPPAVLTVNEVAAYLRIHHSTVYRLVKRGELPGFRVGEDWRFYTAAIIKLTETSQQIEMEIVNG